MRGKPSPGFLPLAASKLPPRRTRLPSMTPDLGTGNAEISIPPPSVPSKNAATTTITSSDQLPSLKLGIKHVEWTYVKESNEWEYVNEINVENAPAERVLSQRLAIGDGSWDDHCFVVIRGRGVGVDGNEQTTFDYVIESEHLWRACKKAFGSDSGVSWELKPVIVSSPIWHNRSVP